MAKLPEGYSIRLATDLDIPAIIAADRAASELFRPTGLIPDMATIPESIPANILAEAIDARMVLVATDPAGPVGFSLSQLKHKSLYLHQLSVDPSHGRKGLGQALMNEVCAAATENARKTVTLSTFRDVPWNGPYYRRLGFKEIARRQMTDWMLEIEVAQAETLDVTQRCFMQKTVRRPLLSNRKSDLKRMTKPSGNGTSEQ